MDLGTLLLILLVLACPVSMIWMMRSRRGKHGHGADDRQQPAADPQEHLTRPEEEQRTAERELDAPGDQTRSRTDGK